MDAVSKNKISPDQQSTNTSIHNPQKTKHKYTKPRQRKPPHLTWFINPRPYPWLKSSNPPILKSIPSTSTSITTDRISNMKIEPVDLDSNNYLDNHELDQPDIHQSIDHNYSIETIQPYRLLIPKTESNNESVNKWFSQNQFEANTKSTQCLIIPSSTENTNNSNDYGQTKNNMRTKSTQCFITSSLNVKKNTGIQCKIKPQQVDMSIQCSTKMCNVKTNTDFRVFHKNASTQANIQRQFNESEFQETNNIKILTTVNVYMTTCMSQVVDIVGQNYPSLHASILPNRLEIIRKDLMDIPCEGEVPCKIIVYSSGKATVVTALRNIREAFDVSSIDKLKYQLFMLSDEGKHVFCPGLDSLYKDIAEKTELVEKMKWPCERMQSKKCLEWYEANRNLPKSNIKRGIARCCNCSKLQSYLKMRKLNPATEEQKLKRINPSSHCTLRCLSPESLKKRKTALTNKQRKIVNVTSNGLDNEEYEELIKIINLMAQDKMLQDSLLSQEDSMQAASLETDYMKSKLGQFSKLKALIMDQKLNKTEDGKSNRWSRTTMKLAIDIYQRSPASYHRLRNLKLLKLPCVRHLKRIKNRSQAESSSTNGNDGIFLMEEQKSSEEQHEIH